VPGDRPDRFDKAVASGADAVLCDWRRYKGSTAKTVDCTPTFANAWTGSATKQPPPSLPSLG
jgi:hypothetical protein